MFSCEFCGISKITFSIEHLRWLLLNTKKNDEISAGSAYYIRIFAVATKNVSKGFALFKDKHQNKVDIVLALCFLSLIPNVKNIMVSFIRIVVYF